MRLFGVCHHIGSTADWDYSYSQWNFLPLECVYAYFCTFQFNDCIPSSSIVGSSSSSNGNCCWVDRGPASRGIQTNHEHHALCQSTNTGLHVFEHYKQYSIVQTIPVVLHSQQVSTARFLWQWQYVDICHSHVSRHDSGCLSVHVLFSKRSFKCISLSLDWVVGTCDCIFLHLGFSRILYRLSNLHSFGPGGCDSVWRRTVCTNVIHTNELIKLFIYVLGGRITTIWRVWQ